MPTKGYIFDIKKYSINDGPGIRTTVFFKGCPLKCWWCHNPESQQLLPEEYPGCTFRWSSSYEFENRSIVGSEISVEKVVDEIIKDIPFYEESGGGITFSGGEPMLQIDFLYELLFECKLKDIHTAIDTTGYTAYENFERIYDITDIFLYDLKLMDNQLHLQYNGVPNIKIHENLIRLSSLGDKIILRIPIIPTITNTSRNINEMIKFIACLKNIRSIDLLPYHKSANAKYERMKLTNRLPNLETPAGEEMEEVKERFLPLNIPVKIGGY